jgi:hypothetical protein
MSASVSITAGEHMFAGTIVTNPAVRLALIDSVSGYAGDGNFTVSYTSAGLFVITEGLPPNETTAQINLGSAVVANGQVFVRDRRNRAATLDTVNDTIAGVPDVDGSALKTGIVTKRVVAAGVVEIANCSDVELTSLADGQVLVWVAADSKWENSSGPPPPPETIEDLTDVQVTSVADGQILVWVAADSKWENEDVPAAPAFPIEDLTDVLVTSIANGQILKWQSSSSKWVNAALPGNPALVALSDVVTASLAAGQVLAWNATTSKWNNVSATGATTLAGLSDVTETSPADGDLLTYVASASKWENKPAAAQTSSPTLALVNGDSTPTLIGDGHGQTIGVSIGTTVPRAGSRIVDYMTVGVSSSMPSPNVMAGALALFLATDNGHMYVWTGTIWSDVT